VPQAGGRPRAKIDLAELEKLCVLQCTQPEIAAFFGVSLATVERRGQHQRFREIMERGYLKGKISVRRKQMQLMEAGDKTMAIWLGKQLLGQRDAVSVEHGGNLEIAPDIAKLRSVIVEALAEYPEAKVAVARRLFEAGRAIDIPHEQIQ